jgi:hypothetical protein
MFKVGDRVRIDTPTFQDVMGVVTSVLPGRSQIIASEFVVNTGEGQYRFFESQLVPVADGATDCHRNS